VGWEPGVIGSRGRVSYRDSFSQLRGNRKPRSWKGRGGEAFILLMIRLLVLGLELRVNWILPYPALLAIWGWLATSNGGFEVRGLQEIWGEG